MSEEQIASGSGFGYGIKDEKEGKMEIEEKNRFVSLFLLELKKRLGLNLFEVE